MRLIPIYGIRLLKLTTTMHFNFWNTFMQKKSIAFILTRLTTQEHVTGNTTMIMSTALISTVTANGCHLWKSD